MNIYEYLVNSTVRIELLDNENTTVSLGTGFFVAKPINNELYKYILVSNKHILRKTDRLALTLTSINNNIEQIVPIRIPIVDTCGSIYNHPDSSIDIAAIDCTGLFTRYFKNLVVNPITIDMFASFDEPDLTYSQTISFIGFPNDRYDKKNNLPLVRTGTIASLPRKDFNGLPQFVIDAQVFPGSSGSPVFIDMTFERFKNNQIDITHKEIKFLGIVSQTMVSNGSLIADYSLDNNDSERYLGLGLVFKATVIKELLDKMPLKL